MRLGAEVLCIPLDFTPLCRFSCKVFKYLLLRQLAQPNLVIRTCVAAGNISQAISMSGTASFGSASMVYSSMGNGSQTFGTTLIRQTKSPSMCSMSIEILGFSLIASRRTIRSVLLESGLPGEISTSSSSKETAVSWTFPNPIYADTSRIALFLVWMLQAHL